MLSAKEKARIANALSGLHYLAENNGGFLVEVDEAELYLRELRPLRNKKGADLLIKHLGGVPTQYQSRLESEPAQAPKQGFWSKLFSTKKYP